MLRKDTDCFPQRPLAGWKHAHPVPHHGKDRGFVDGHPGVDITQRSNNMFAIANKRRQIGLVCKTAFAAPANWIEKSGAA